MIETLLAGKASIANDESNYVSLIHVSDMARAFVAALNLAPAGSIFNIVDEPLRFADYADELAESVGAAKPGRCRTLKRPPSWRCSSEKARIVLCWTPQKPIIPIS